MSCSFPVLQISANDCLGDSLGKHNYNALVLDTSVCNLSALLFNSDYNVISVFNQLSALSDQYVQFMEDYQQQKVYDVLTTTTAVTLLSSYWQVQEFTVQYPINAYSQDQQPLVVLTLSAVNQNSIVQIIESRLKPLALSYLNANFPVTEYLVNTVINIVFFMHNLTPNDDPSLGTGDNLGNAQKFLITQTHDPVDFAFHKRKMTATFTRDNIHLTKGVTLTYFNQNSAWNYQGAMY